MDRQEVFNRIVKHARTMKCKANSTDKDSCLYRSPTGPCLIGSLIEDKWYRSDIEYLSADEESVIVALENSGIECIAEGDGAFLFVVQGVHDDLRDDLKGAAFKSSLMKGLKNIAERYKLEFPNV